jgi:hypothetical protein
MIAIFSSNTNFVSAASECFGQGLDHQFCVGTITLSNGEVHSWVYECVKDNTGTWDCHDLTKTNVMPPGLKAEIDATVRAEEQSNTNDPRDLGGIKSDKGMTKSPIE